MLVRSKRYVSFCYAVCLLLSYPLQARSAWIGPIEIIHGFWGSGAGQVYFQPQDTADSFPRTIAVDIDSNVIIPDDGNKRILIYNKYGELKHIVRKPKELPNVDTTYYWPIGFKLLPNRSFIIACDFEKNENGINSNKQCIIDYRGKIHKKINVVGEVLNLNNGFVIISHDKYYYYKFSGEKYTFISTTFPSELGTVPGRGKYWEKPYRVIYPDHTFYVDQQIRKFKRDMLGNLYMMECILYGNDEKEPQSCQHIVFRYDRCTDEKLKFMLPKSKYEPYPANFGEYPSYKPVPVLEYGEPVIAPNGDLYCWARTKKEYRILKWSWVEDRNGPYDLLAEAPVEDKNILRWKKPLQESSRVVAYEIERSRSTCGPYEIIGKVKRGVLSFTDKEEGLEKTDLFCQIWSEMIRNMANVPNLCSNAEKEQAGTTYYYRARALYKNGHSGYSNKAIGRR